MVHMMEGSSLKSPLRSFNVLVFLLLTHLDEGQSQAMAPSESVVSMVGGDAVLPCRLEAGLDAAQVTVEWGRPDLEPRFVYIWHNGKELTNNQNAAYKGRASMSADELKQGNSSLKLTQLKISDNGRYRCYIPKHDEEYFVELLVGSVSSPSPSRTSTISLSGLDRTHGSVELQCESAGWYPQPEVLWLDGDGNLLSAGPTETVRGPDDLYTVSSRVTVEKRHSNNFTCRVQQKKINQSRETVIQVSDDFFEVSSSCAASVAFSVIFGLMLVFTVSLFVWKWKQNKIKRKQLQHPKEEGQQLMTEINKIEDLDKKKAKLDEEFMKNEEEQNNVTQTIESLQKITKELETQKEKLKSQSEEADKKSEEQENKMKSLDEEVMKKEGDKTANKAQGYMKLKDIMTEVIWSLEERKKDHQQLNMNTESIIKAAYDEVDKQKEKKQKLQISREQMKQQIEEMENHKKALQSKLQSDNEGK
ncbi:butyrophilin subfamily 3 member A2-like isoform X1 [Acanthochromis polyacanthus]|uniref:butyrophilin subfamily 3 member A2-like isoform X1 n=1 Tax=Acanthochromis polyacanthus TaxID=80966 RepID=UPI002234122D|nr:butyrophilin subfamily 3 member A2-like isoform X1 [Acanthochromis polyacanthus]XP_051799881.1 butyrophilin subfamily 3 member A2-like isoform X1 [Acanthochromis polyacanthus]